MSFIINSSNEICSFCGKKYVDKDLIFIHHTNNVSICDTCVNLCYRNLRKEKVITHQRRYTPKAIYKLLREYVVGQDKVAASLSVAFFKHLVSSSGMNYIKDNQLLIGPTGSGKTYLLEVAARLFELPMAICDCSILTASGYIGEDVDSIIHRLLQATNFNVEKAQRGIVFLDEIDKIASSSLEGYKDVGGKAVQYELLRMLEGTKTKIYLDFRRQYGRSVDFDTKDVLFFAGGAFTGLNVPSLTSAATNAITPEPATGTAGSLSIIRDALRQYGMIPELLARFSTFNILKRLNKQDYLEILSREIGYISYYLDLFASYGVSITISDEIRDFLASDAVRMDAGARSLHQLLERMFNMYLFNIEDYQGQTITPTVDDIRRGVEDVSSTSVLASVSD